MRLEGRVTIVTGGAPGIGARVCERFAAEGASVVVVDRDGEGAAKRAANLGRAEAMCVDICDVAAVNDCVAAVVASYGRLDVLANIAGVDDPAAKDLVRQQMSDGQPLDITSTLSDEQWHRMLSINLNGTFYFLRAALRQMLPRRSGSIINMPSLAAVVGVAAIPHYPAATAAVDALPATVVVVARREDRLRELASQLQHGSWLAADLQSPGDVARVVPAVLERHQRVDVVVNNAGGAHIGSALNETLDTFTSTLQLNLVAPFVISQAAAADMRTRSSGSIVMVSSTAGIRQNRSVPQAAYVAAKS